MTKNITIGVLSFLIVFFVVFANIKAEEAVKQTILAEQNFKLAKKYEEMAKAQEEKSVEISAQAMIAQRRAAEMQKQLDDCNK